MNLQARIDADARRAIVNILAYDADYSLNSNIIYCALEDVGKTVTRDQLSNHLAWLAEQGLVINKTIATSLMLTRLTDRGLDVAKGKAKVIGVRDLRPSELHEIGQDNLLG